jgi:hypothetical protein
MHVVAALHCEQQGHIKPCAALLQPLDAVKQTSSECFLTKRVLPNKQQSVRICRGMKAGPCITPGACVGRAHPASVPTGAAAHSAGAAQRTWAPTGHAATAAAAVVSTGLANASSSDLCACVVVLQAATQMPKPNQSSLKRLSPALLQITTAPHAVH